MLRIGCVLSGGRYLLTFTNVTSLWRHWPQWIPNFYIVRIYRSLGNSLEIWKNMNIHMSGIIVVVHLHDDQPQSH